MNKIGRLISALNCLANPIAMSLKTEQRQVRLLGWILLFIILFSIATLFAILIFNPQNGMRRNEFTALLGGLIVFFTLAYVLNCTGHYIVSATFLIAFVAITPWVTLLLDPAVLQGDFVPLFYATFSIGLSSILLPTYVTLVLAVLQFAGITLVLIFSPAIASFNWFSFLVYIFLTSVFSIFVNNIIQRDMKQIADQAHQLALSEALLREQSIHDYLTNLFNRRYLEATLEREIHRAERELGPLGIIMVDVDDFKCINDTLGHAAGDTILQELGKFLGEQICEPTASPRD